MFNLTFESTEKQTFGDRKGSSLTQIAALQNCTDTVIKCTPVCLLWPMSPLSTPLLKGCYWAIIAIDFFSPLSTPLYDSWPQDLPSAAEVFAHIFGQFNTVFLPFPLKVYSKAEPNKQTPISCQFSSIHNIDEALLCLIVCIFTRHYRQSWHFSLFLKFQPDETISRQRKMCEQIKLPSSVLDHFMISKWQNWQIRMAFQDCNLSLHNLIGFWWLKRNSFV